MNIETIINNILSIENPPVLLETEEMSIFAEYLISSGFEEHTPEGIIYPVIFTGLLGQKGLRLTFKQTKDSEGYIFHTLIIKERGIIEINNQFKMTFTLHTDDDIPATVHYGRFGNIERILYYKEGENFRENNKPYTISFVGKYRYEWFSSYQRDIYINRIDYNNESEINTIDYIYLMVDKKQINIEHAKEIIEKIRNFSMDDLFNIDKILSSDEINLIKIMTI